MKYRIHYKDKFHNVKTLIYEVDFYYQVEKLRDTLDIIKIECLDKGPDVFPWKTYRPDDSEFDLD